MICKKCGVDKPESEYYKYRSTSGNILTQKDCKLCRISANNEWKKNNRATVNLRRREAYAKDPKRFNDKNKERYYLDHEETLKKGKKRRLSLAYKKSQADYREKNKEAIKAKKKEYYQKNKKKIQARQSVYNKKLYANSEKKRLSNNISCYVRQCCNGSKNFRKWETIVGYTLKELMNHLESQFKDGMSWDSYGKWHVDHIRPIASFNFTKPEDKEFKQCWALSNLQPLWAKDNIAKGSKWVA